MINPTKQVVSGLLLFSSLGNVSYVADSISYHSNSSSLYSYKSVFLGKEQQKSYKRLDELATYGVDWNGNGASPFPSELIDKCKNIVNELRYQPEIFPTAIDAIQFEYRKSDGSYLEFEIYLDKANVFRVDSDKSRFTKTISLDEVKKEVDAFYEDK